MEILFISHKYPPSIGGMQKHSFELATRLKKKCTVHTLIYDGTNSQILFFVNLKKRIKKVLRENPRISLIYLNDGLMTSFVLWLKNYTTIPVVASVHGLDIVFPSEIFQHKIIPQFNKLDGIIAVSHPTAQECLKRGIAGSKLFPIKNGIDHDIAEKPIVDNFRKILEQKSGRSLEGKQLIVSLGRPVKRKGFVWFIKNVLLKLPEDVVFIMIGPEGNTSSIINALFKILPNKLQHKIELFFGMGSDGATLKRLLKNPLYKDRLLHLGRQPFDDIIQTIRTADLFVVPNIPVEGDFEGFGLVALEAAICGTPVVAAAVDGLQDAIVNEKNGFQVPSEDERAWARKINELLGKPDYLQSFGRRASSFTRKEYDWDKMVNQYFQVFKRVVYKSLRA